MLWELNSSFSTIQFHLGLNLCLRRGVIFCIPEKELASSHLLLTNEIKIKKMIKNK